MSLTPDQMKACLKAKAEGKSKPEGLPKYPLTEKHLIEKATQADQERYWKDRRAKRIESANRGLVKLEEKLTHIQGDLSHDPEIQIKKMIAMYKQNMHDLHARIDQHIAGMETARKLYEKNKWRETHKIEEMQDSVKRVEAYIDLCEKTINDRRYVCVECNKEYKTEKGLLAHLDAKHPEIDIGEDTG